jgi:aldose sugar dehydrogenase
MNSTTQDPSPLQLLSKISNINNTNFTPFTTDNNSSNLIDPASSSDLTLAATPTLKDPNLKVQTVATGLNSPTSMAFLGLDDILVLEKNTGMVKRIKDNTVLPQPLLDLNVASQSERGLLGIDVQKISSSQYYVFLYYTQSTQDAGTPIANRLYRYLLTIGPNLGPAQGTMTSPKLLLNLPVTPGPNHDGGKVVVSPSGYVYTVLGDLNRNRKSQNFEDGRDPDGTSGVLRVTRDGNPVGTGIFGTTHPLNKYVAYGIRNSFGMDFDPLSGRLWETENGPSSNDEINIVFNGFNGGWEDIMGMAPAGFNFDNLVNLGGKGIYANPKFVWTQVVAPTAIEFLTSASLGTPYQNDMFVGDFKHGRIYNFNLNSQRTALVLTGALSDRVANIDSETQSVIFGEGFGGISDLKVGAVNGYLYILSIGHGAVYRILPNM